MNFWFLPEGAEDDELIEDAGTTEQLERNKNKFLGDQETRANEKGKSKIEEDKIKRKESIKGEENMTKINKTGPIPYTAGELIGLSREIETIIGEALGNVTKVKISGYLLGRVD